jgi:septal ring factor EnvC (AmiA/AmiB activator)
LAAEALALADRMRALSNNDLAAEIARLSGPGTTPLNQLTLALALLQFPAPAEGQRVAALLQGIITNGSDDARPLHPLARQVASQHAQQRRLEEQLERQAQQLREAQRRIDQLSERLEALRAIERSMPSRAR